MLSHIRHAPSTDGQAARGEQSELELESLALLHRTDGGRLHCIAFGTRALR